MGGIDEAALDRLSLVTEMTKHIRVRASGGKTTASELGQFSPIFVWLLRVTTYSCLFTITSNGLVILFSYYKVFKLQDFYLDLAEDNRKITPRDYLELALRPVNGAVRDIAAKNEVSYLVTH